jgi:hypothetical protein
MHVKEVILRGKADTVRAAADAWYPSDASRADDLADGLSEEILAELSGAQDERA